MQQDASYGLRQLVDVALKALSPGINDPTTAQDAIFHAAAVLVGARCCATHRPRSAWAMTVAASCWPSSTPTTEMVGLTFDEIRRAAANQPTVCIYLLEALELAGGGAWKPA